MAQFKDTLVVELDENTVYEMKGRPCELSAYSFIPPRRTAPKAKTYFNVDRQIRQGNAWFVYIGYGNLLGL